MLFQDIMSPGIR